MRELRNRRLQPVLRVGSLQEEAMVVVVVVREALNRSKREQDREGERGVSLHSLTRPFWLPVRQTGPVV